MGQITRISTRDYRTDPMYSHSPEMLPKYITRTGRLTGIEVLREHVDLIENPNSVLRVNSQLLRGATESGKKWTRWHTTRKDIISARPNKAGSMRLNYLYYTPRTGIKNHTPYIDLASQFLNNTDVFWKIQEFLQNSIPERFETWTKNSSVYRSLFYPGYLHSEITVDPARLYPRLRVALREENAIDMTLSAFGKRLYRKDMVKSMATCQFASNIELAILVRNLMKTDWLVEIMRHERILDTGVLSRGIMVQDLGKYFPVVLSRIPENRRRRFVLSLADNHRQFNADAVIMGVQLPAESFATVRTVADMHELGVANRPQRQLPNGRLYAPPARYDIELNDLSKKYDGIKTDDGLRIVAPRNSETLNEWTNYMSNCISGYARQAAEGLTNLGAVFDEDKLIANFEIDPKGNLKQLLGKYNNHLDLSEQSDIIETLEENGAVNVESLNTAWGVDLLTANA